MFSTDYHVHSSHSFDCHISMDDQICNAINKKIQEICFTDHIELGFSEWNYQEMDLDAYFFQIQKCREKYPQIAIKTGAEAGITCSSSDLQRTVDLLQKYPFDFVIASSHRINNVTLFCPDHYENQNFPDFCKEYIQNLISSLKIFDNSLYNCVGHIDLPIKPALRFFSDFSWKEFKYEYASDEIDELIKLIISYGKCLEINTASWLLPNRQAQECKWLKRYAEMGGEYVTFGSDAHISSGIGKYYREAVILALESGIRYLAIFKDRQPEYIPLSQCL